MLKVENLINDTWQVVEYKDDEPEEDYEGYIDRYLETLYQGSLADCEAFIRLKEQGRLNQR